MEKGVRRTVFRTPHGEMQYLCVWDEPSHSWHPMEFPVKSLEDIKLMTEFYEDVTIELDPAGLEKSKAEAKELGQGTCTMNHINNSPFMFWVEFLAGIENSNFFLMDYPDEVEALLAAHHRNTVRRTELMCEHSVADVFLLTEDTSTTMISPEQYRRYCAPITDQYARIVNSADRNLVIHMCGHLKGLLPDLAKIPAQAFEAFTSPSLGNTTLLDGRSHCPNTCLIGGTNAVLWTKSGDEIIATLEHDLNELPHHRGIVVTSGGVMPPMCKPETIQRVCEWVKQYPVRMD